MTTAVVQFSTGIGSAEVAYRATADHRYSSVVLLTADTLIEDEDNWRFAREVWRDLGEPQWGILRDGRTPMQVGRDRSCIPSSRMPVCSQELKIKPLRAFIDATYSPDDAVIMLGFDWTEEHRFDKAKPHWAPFELACPLMAEPWMTKAQMLDASRERGIEPPRLYAMGAPHANCGGGCVRSGQAAWVRLLRWNPERYGEWEKDEQVSRDFLDKDVAILRHRSGAQKGQALTLRSLRERVTINASLFDADDEGACGCTDYAEPA